MSRKHSKIEQLDGNTSIDSDDEKEDQTYSETERYWRTGNLTTVFQSFLDANEIVDGSNLSEEEKVVEKAKVLEARKIAFSDEY